MRLKEKERILVKNGLMIWEITLERGGTFITLFNFALSAALFGFITLSLKEQGMQEMNFPLLFCGLLFLISIYQMKELLFGNWVLSAEFGAKDILLRFRKGNTKRIAYSDIGNVEFWIQKKSYWGKIRPPVLTFYGRNREELFRGDLWRRENMLMVREELRKHGLDFALPEWTEESYRFYFTPLLTWDKEHSSFSRKVIFIIAAAAALIILMMLAVIYNLFIDIY